MAVMCELLKGNFGCQLGRFCVVKKLPENIHGALSSEVSESEYKDGLNDLHSHIFGSDSQASNKEDSGKESSSEEENSSDTDEGEEGCEFKQLPLRLTTEKFTTQRRT